MLQLFDIKKDYFVAGEAVPALKGISLNFRKNEFVSILGASGCGKTTLLNIIGGLDKYTSGDLVINGTSTKQYKDGDWDTYRNHSIGFIFQSYHLIPHQTILQNVELALVIAGVSKEERRRRAVEALERVGLKEKMNSRPNQLSGGQAQRVAIARALINDPEIVLADEPTGALDSKTSVQIMDLLKEISKDRLVIMVTHNPELAEQYSTRIIRLLDGLVTDDSSPYDGMDEILAQAEQKEEVKEADAAENTDNENAEAPKHSKGKKKRSSMSAGMAFMLSLKNLLSKWKRTLMVSLAGSIGIIGVSMVLAISSGVQGYIRDMENDMLSGNPISVERSSFDMSAVTQINKTLNKSIKINKLKDKVYVDSLLQTFLDMGNNFFTSNEISENYLDYVSKMPEEYYSAIKYSYDFEVSNYIYTDFNVTSELSPTEIAPELDASSDGMSLTAIRSMYTSVLAQEKEYSNFISMLDMFTGLQEVPEGSDYILTQYDVIATNGKLSDAEISQALNDKQSLILVVDEGKASEIDLAQFGFLSEEELLNYAYVAAGRTDAYNPEIGLPGSGIKDKDPYYDESLGAGGLNFNFFFDKQFKFYPNDSIFTKEDGTPVTFKYNSYSKEFSDEGSLDLGVKLILQKKKNVSYGCLSDGLYYTPALTKHIIEQGLQSEIAQYVNTNGPLAGISYSFDFTFSKTENGNKVYYKQQGAGKFTQQSMFGSSDIVTSGMVAGSKLASGVFIYPLNFDMKNKVCTYLDGWNKLCDDGAEYNGSTLSEKHRVKYTDMVGVIIDMVNTMIQMVTIALVAFTALSLVVSTVMVGIITYVSVVERTKEIGILRSVGARKKDIKLLFIAETFMIGLAAGVTGILITYIVSLVINLIVSALFAISTIAALPVWQALIMIVVSVALTLISGLIPAAAAAKKDPVVALRTE